MEFLVGLIVGVIGTFIVIDIVAKAAQKLGDKDLDDKIEKGLTKLRETIIPSRIEHVNGMLYLYNKETNDFIAQGKDFEELNENAKKRFPEKLFNVSQAEINLIKGNV
jgi:hypothetical protein